MCADIVQKDNREKEDNLSTNKKSSTYSNLPTDITQQADKMYQDISRTLRALDTVTIDGESSIPIHPELVALSLKRLIPDTESQMLLSNALPLSEADVVMIQRKKKFTESLQYLKEQVRLTSLTLAETTGPRVRVAYRLCRYMTHIRGIGPVGEPMLWALRSDDVNINRYEIPEPYIPEIGWFRGLAALRQLLQNISESQYTYTYQRYKNIVTIKGMSILPPPLPDQYLSNKPHIDRKNGVVPVNYDPKGDVPLAYYLNIMEFLVRHLGIGGGEHKIAGGFAGIKEGLPGGPTTINSINTDDRGAVLALLNPEIARLAWPSRDDLETFEEYILFPYIEQLLIDHSQIAAEDTLKAEMGLTRSEALDYVEAAKFYAREVHNYVPEKERSILISKIQNLAERCDKASMVTTELNSFKVLSQILHLTKHEEDTNLDKREGLKNALKEKIAGGKPIIDVEMPDNQEE